MLNQDFKEFIQYYSFVKLFKIISTMLMLGAIAVELWLIFTLLNQQPLSNLLLILSAIASVAMIIHLGEGIVAGFWAAKKGQNPIQSAIYVFFTGTVSLLEMRSAL